MFKLQGCVALVTGSNRGLGKVFCEHLLQSGAAKVYAAAREPAKIHSTDSRVIPIKVDITSAADIASAAQRCQDLTLLVNNAGIARNSPVIHPDAEGAARDEMNTNFFGTLAMVQRFAPILAKNGGGAILNVLIVDRSLTGLDTGIDRVLADDRAVEVDTRLRTSRAAFDAELQRLWDSATPARR